MSSPFVAVPKYSKLGEGFSAREKLAAQLHPGRSKWQSPASWILDLVSLRKPVLLCSFCRSKFNPRHFNYRKFYMTDHTGTTDGFVANGKCDACRQNTADVPGGGVMFVAEELYSLTCIDPCEARRNARAAWKGHTTAWGMIQKQRRRKN